MKLPNIEVGFQVFVSEGGQEIGAVRQVAPFDRPELEIYVGKRRRFRPCPSPRLCPFTLAK
jgi:hypothetical protein